METKEKIKYLFQANTSETTYKKELVRLVIIVLIFALMIFTNVFGGITELWMRIVIILPIFSTVIFLLLFSLARLLNISDNVDQVKKKSGHKKYKYNSVFVPTDKLMRYLINFELITDLDIIIDTQIYNIGISMDYDNKKNQFFDKKYTLDKIEYDTIDPITHLLETNGLMEQGSTVEVLAVDSMNPKNFPNQLDLVV